MRFFYVGSETTKFPPRLGSCLIRSSYDSKHCIYEGLWKLKAVMNLNTNKQRSYWAKFRGKRGTNVQYHHHALDHWHFYSFKCLLRLPNDQFWTLCVFDIEAIFEIWMRSVGCSLVDNIFNYGAMEIAQSVNDLSHMHVEGPQLNP